MRTVLVFCQGGFATETMMDKYQVSFHAMCDSRVSNVPSFASRLLANVWTLACVDSTVTSQTR